MSFGPTDQTSAGMNQLQSNAGATSTAGAGLLNLGNQNTNDGANFFRTLLSGNGADTSAMLQPDVNRINAGNQQTLQSASTLMPRGGGRSSTLFSLPFQGNQQIQSLFNGARTNAAQALPQIGAGQTNAGANLFSIGNNAAGTLGQLGQNQQQITDKLWSQLGSGLFGLATMPLGGLGGTLAGKIPGVGG